MVIDIFVFTHFLGYIYIFSYSIYISDVGRYFNIFILNEIMNIIYMYDVKYFKEMCICYNRINFIIICIYSKVCIQH